LILAPIIYVCTHSSLRGYFHLHASGPVWYVLRNAAYPVSLQYGIGDVFAETTPWGLVVGTSVINGSLWSLPLEIRCYGITLIVAILGRYFGIERFSFFCLALTGCLVVLNHVNPSLLDFLPSQVFPVAMLELVFVFMCGCLVGANSHLIRIGSLIGTVVVVTFLVAMSIGGLTFRTIGLGSTCLLAPLLASKLSLNSTSALRHDLSYGAYLWSFPVQQTLSFSRVHELSFAGYVIASIVLTLGMATLSWFIVEAPVLNKYQTFRMRKK
jgi:peptidoglycan/LPS O-acetylase OafA/YrhL